MTIISLVLRASTNLQRIGNVLDVRDLNPNISLRKNQIMLIKYKTNRNKRILIEDYSRVVQIQIPIFHAMILLLLISAYSQQLQF